MGRSSLKQKSTQIKFRDFKIKPRINDNTGVPFRKVPTYFIFIEPELNNTLKIQKIFNNPTLDIDIDVSQLKNDLLSMANDINATLDLEPLKSYDNGRWFLILSESSIFECNTS